MKTTTQNTTTITVPDEDVFGGTSGGVLTALIAAFVAAGLFAVIGGYIDFVNHPNVWMSGVDGFFAGIALGMALGPLVNTGWLSRSKRQDKFLAGGYTTLILSLPLLIWIATGSFFQTFASVMTYCEVFNGFGF